ncbi:MAG TPA: sodium:solute symporter family protein [Candidatus Acidoferrales bacterium]|jgi:SSS family solute:Na+ symporter|nr:sodium:solute symporter family protein [Candidatus Acidoferrales bacterium]
MEPIHLHKIDYTILLAYVAFVIGIGWMLARYMKTSADFLTSARSIPTWVTGLAFISANLGALELVGMAASGAKYGIATAHFYWVGAIPAMIFLAVFMMPFYYGSKARSTPEYLNMRFDGRVRGLNAIAFAVMTIFASGISMDALAKLLNQLLGWNYNFALLICSGVVLLYVLKGGLTSAIYTEVLQFFMIVLGFAPVVYLGLKDAGGWGAMTHSLQAVAVNPAAQNLKDVGITYAPNAWTSAWTPVLAGPAHNPMGVDWFAMIFGLGFVLSFGYWCTNFLVVQRAMAAKNMTAARNTPLVAAVPKMFFPFLVIVPGMIAVALTSMPDKNYRIPPPIVSQENYAKAIDAVKSASPADSVAAVKAVGDALGVKVAPDKIASLVAANATSKLPDAQIKQGLYNSIAENYYSGVILSLVTKYCPPGLMGLALTALLASFMSGMAGNVTAFNTVFTYDLYQAYLVKGKSDRHYFLTGKAITVVGIILSMGAAYFASMFDNAMDVIQLVFGFVNAPIFATFLLGMFWKRTTGTGAFIGLFGGIFSSALFHALTTTPGNLDAAGHVINIAKGGYLHVVQVFPSEMAQNFWLASFAFIACFTLTLLISLATSRTKSDAELKGLVYSLTPKIVDNNIPIYQKPAVVGVVLLIVCIILNFIFW